MPIPTKREDTVDVIHGIPVPDPFHWLEDIGDHAVRKWIERQNHFVDDSLKHETFELFSNELARNFHVVNFSNPVPVRGNYFYTERQPTEDQACIYVRHGIDGEPIKLVDPNGTSSHNTTSIDFWFPSQTGKLLAYGLSQSGDEMATLYVKDVATNQDLADVIPRCRYSAVRWMSDDSGFFYTRNPREGEVPENESHLHTNVYFHKLGDDPMSDELIFGKDLSKDIMLGLAKLSADDRYLAIDVSMTWTENELFIYDRTTKETKTLVENIPAKFMLTFTKDSVIVRTNYQANNFRLLSTPIANLFAPIETWKEIVAETESLMVTASITKSKLIVEYLENACSSGVLFDHAGNKLDTLSLPEYSSLLGIFSNREEEEFFYGVESYTFPRVVFHCKADGACVVFRKTDNPVDQNDYVVKQEWFVSKDGTCVPMFLFHRKDVDITRPSPTILYGYGGFANIDSPVFMRNYVPWTSRGGIFAIANIRGNAEFGESWHEQGIKEHKQNSFDDFIAAAEYLIAQGYTDRDHLGILGGSNGGLLTAAVEVQRPDLFRAVCSRVPLTDMVRFPKFGIASRWIHEYGDPTIKDDLEHILKWSPYHNVRDGVEYPSTLFMTGMKDTRVDPLHARKMAAQLQTTNKSNPIYIVTEMEAGHGAGKPIKKIVENAALTLTFFAERLQLTLNPSP